jgi:hypothetical protein
MYLSLIHIVKAVTIDSAYKGPGVCPLILFLIHQLQQHLQDNLQSTLTTLLSRLQSFFALKSLKNFPQLPKMRFSIIAVIATAFIGSVLAVPAPAVAAVASTNAIQVEQEWCNDHFRGVHRGEAYCKGPQRHHDDDHYCEHNCFRY